MPALASVSVDVRVPTAAAQQRIDELMRELTPRIPGARLEVLSGVQRPPREPESSADLFTLASRVAAEPGQALLHGMPVGGASDGDWTAATDCPALDGLGAVGDGAQADTEYVEVAQMIPRTRRLTELITGTVR